MLPQIRGVARIGKDIELRYTASGMAIAKTSLAFGSKEKKNDEWVDVTCWLDAVFFGKTGERLNQYLSKGQRIEVSGRLKQDSWVGQDGQKRSKYNLVVEQFDFVEKNESHTEKKPRKKPEPEIEIDDISDEIPF